ncbi:MAG: hypothetical protein R2801_10120 [Chitinophagales bacterium]
MIKSNEPLENIELKQRIEQLEKALLNSELRATALDTMIEVAEKELKISIRKSQTPNNPRNESTTSIYRIRKAMPIVWYYTSILSALQPSC